MIYTHKGFTLIELLVVVLIIGILAAIALPQYQKAVAKSRVSVYLPIMNAIANAKEIYYLDYGHYPSQGQAFDMDVQMPSTCRNLKTGNGRALNDWACEDGFLFDMNGAAGVRLAYCPGKDANGNEYTAGGQNVCLRHIKYQIWRFQDHADPLWSRGQRWFCFTELTDLGRKVCPSLGMTWYDE